MTNAHPSPVTELLDREAIRDCIHRSALGNDMLDPDLWKSTYWDDGQEDHDAMFVGNAHRFVEEVGTMIRSAMDATFHQVSNTIIRFDDADTAHAISYATVYSRMVDGAGKRTDLIAGVRYFDRFEKRGGEWRIFDRKTKSDWIRLFDDSLDWDAPDPGTGQVRHYGARHASDPARTFLGRGARSGILAGCFDEASDRGE
jgi:hypothetical protein